MFRDHNTFHSIHGRVRGCELFPPGDVSGTAVQKRTHGALALSADVLLPCQFTHGNNDAH